MLLIQHSNCYHLFAQFNLQTPSSLFIYLYIINICNMQQLLLMTSLLLVINKKFRNKV